MAENLTFGVEGNGADDSPSLGEAGQRFKQLQ